MNDFFCTAILENSPVLLVYDKLLAKVTSASGLAEHSACLTKLLIREPLATPRGPDSKAHNLSWRQQRHHSYWGKDYWAREGGRVLASNCYSQVTWSPQNTKCLFHGTTDTILDVVS